MKKNNDEFCCLLNLLAIKLFVKEYNKVLLLEWLMWTSLGGR